MKIITPFGIHDLTCATALSESSAVSYTNRREKEKTEIQLWENIMNKITLEKTHALLEKLAEFVMNEVSTKQETNKRFEQLEQRLEKTEQQKADKTDVRKILDGLDSQAKQLDIIRTEQTATLHVINRIEKRVANLEEKETGYRIRDKRE